MSIRVGINGFGRIGRNFYRAARDQGADLDVVAVNDLGSIDTMAHLLSYDSVHGRLGDEVSVDGDVLSVGDDSLRVLSVRNPEELPWGDLGVDVVVESTGIFTKRDTAARHLDGGAPRVLVSAPCSGADATFVVGVNDDQFDPAVHTVVSNASCTTNCFVPMVKVLDDAFGVDRGLMTTVHAYTNDQALVDGPTSDLRRARAAAVRTSSRPPPARPGPPGSCCPSHAGKPRRHGAAVFPSPTALITDFTARLDSRAAASTRGQRGLRRGRVRRPLNGVLDYTESSAGVAPTSSARPRQRDLGRRAPPCRMGRYGEGRRLVRQRVGLLQPAGGHGRHRRRGQPLSGRSPHRPLCAARSLPGGLGPAGGPLGAGAGRFQRPARGRGSGHGGRDRRRSAHPGCASHVALAARPRGDRHRLHPSGPPGRGSPIPATRCSRCAGGWRSWPRRWNCSRTCVSTRARPPTTPVFAERLVEGHDAYVNDAFGASHRAHASIVGPPRWLPSAAGRLLAREVEVLGGLRDAPRRPFVAVLGGAKVSDKLGVIDALLEMVDALVIGGAMCFTFLKAQGHRVGASLCEDSMVDHCRELLDGDTPVHLPYDLTALGPGGVPGDPGAGGEVRQVGSRRARRLDGCGHRPRERGPIRGRDPRGGDGAVERPDGRVRGSPLRGRHRGGGRSHGRDPGLHRGGRGATARRQPDASASTETWTTCPPAGAPPWN